MKYRAKFVEWFTSTALDKPARESVQLIDGHWIMVIKGNRAEWAEIVQAAGVPSHAEQVIDGDMLTIRWPSIADRIFAADGLIAQHLPNYEMRRQQLHMARLVQRSIELGEPCVVEAGTGVGKGFAYAAVAMAMGKRVIISTSNKALQEQLFNKDLPFLCRIFPGKKIAKAMGKSNYLCRNKCQDKLGNTLIQDYALASFYHDTDSGNVEDLDFHIQDQNNWTADDDCTGKRCHFYANCFYFKAKQERNEADVIITNHALLTLHYLYPMANILPTVAVTVVDEAHQLANYVRNALGTEVALPSISLALSGARAMAEEVDAEASYTATADAHLQKFWNEVRVFVATAQASISMYASLNSGGEQMAILASKMGGPFAMPDYTDILTKLAGGIHMPAMLDSFKPVFDAFGDLPTSEMLNSLKPLWEVPKLDALIPMFSEEEKKYFEETEELIREACAALGIDPDEPHEIYDNMDFRQFFRRVDAARRLQQIQQQMKVGTVPDNEIEWLLKNNRSSRLKPGTRPEAAYDKAFERCYISKSCTRSQAFDLMIEEEGIFILTESDRADRFNAFVSAMKRRTAKFNA